MQDEWRLSKFVKRLIPHAIILLYHRVTELPEDPQLLCVSPHNFTEHLEVMRKNFHVCDLNSMVTRIRSVSRLSRTVVLTFDDGYADNFWQARPLLERFDVPATVFTVVGQLNSRREFWWDELERILLRPVHLPEKLKLTIDGQSYLWEFGSESQSMDIPVKRWHVLMGGVPSPHQVAYLKISALLRDQAQYTRNQVLDTLAEWAGLEDGARDEYRGLDVSELQSMASDNLIEIGAHTLTHPVLSQLPENVQRMEIGGSKKKIEEILGRQVSSFSYPYGTRRDYSADTVKYVREAGFSCACSNYGGHVRWVTDLFQLPRFLVRDWNGEEFSRNLYKWFGYNS